MHESPTVGLALIARDEERTLPTLLASVEGAFDEVALVDTGSTDRTVEVFEQWAAEERGRQHAFRSTAGHLRWRDDFAFARNFACGRLATDWVAWADADDEFRGARNLRGLVAAASAEVGALRVRYTRVRTASGAPLTCLDRTSVYRAGRGTWQGRVHETLEVRGERRQVPPGELELLHLPPPGRAEESFERNARILRLILEEDPDNPVALRSFGSEAASRDRHDEAIAYYERHLRSPKASAWERSIVHVLLVKSLLARERREEALEVAAGARAELPGSAETNLSLAEASLAAGRPREALRWASEVLALGSPSHGPVTRPLEYHVRPRLVMAAAYRELGDFDRSVAIGREALEAEDAWTAQA